MVTPTYHGNLLIGPDAIDEDGEADRSTHVERLAGIYDQALRTVPKLDPGQFLRSFAGVRAVSSTDDFIVEESASPGFSRRRASNPRPDLLPGHCRPDGGAPGEGGLPPA